LLTAVTFGVPVHGSHPVLLCCRALLHPFEPLFVAEDQQHSAKRQSVHCGVARNVRLSEPSFIAISRSKISPDCCVMYFVLLLFRLLSCKFHASRLPKIISQVTQVKLLLMVASFTFLTYSCQPAKLSQ